MKIIIITLFHSIHTEYGIIGAKRNISSKSMCEIGNQNLIVYTTLLHTIANTAPTVCIRTGRPGQTV